MACVRIILFLAGCFVVANGRLSFDVFETVKPGTCPRSLAMNVCWERCAGDGQCAGIEKCCPTDCGGTACSIPVIASSMDCGGTACSIPVIEKPGVCPSTATGPWVCSSTCSSDDHCEGTKKCCKNRCDAFACQIPEIGKKPRGRPEVADYEFYNDK